MSGSPVKASCPQKVAQAMLPQLQHAGIPWVPGSTGSARLRSALPASSSPRAGAAKVFLAVGVFMQCQLLVSFRKA